MTDLNSFMPSVLQYAHGCPIPTVHFGLRQAAIEFCERTRMWRHEDEFSVAGADLEDIIAMPEGSVVHEIESAWLNERKLDPKTVAWLDSNVTGWRDGIDGMPSYITQTEINAVRVVPKQDGTLRLALLLKPSQDADSLPDFLAEQYRETIAQGALARILIMPNRSFTNFELGSAFGGVFQSKLNSLSSKGSTGQQRAPVRTRASFL